MTMRTMAVAALAGAACTSAANATLVAHWNFNDSTANSTSTQVGVLNSTGPNSGTGAMTIGGGSPVITYNTISAGTANGCVGTFGGTTTNAVGADPSGGALAITASVGANSNNPVTANGCFVTFQISMTNFIDLNVSFATRGTGTGFRSAQLAYSTDNSSFTDFGSPWDGGSSGTFFVISRDLSAVNSLDNAANVYIRLTFNGATGGGGNNRVDNVQFNATLIPAPGALALLGLGGLVSARRRRA
ncbi:MAG: hypothetical protein JNM07_06115 [Phycisphaerae bacterium]|nr:hypothetical protein [Phycisphaerae bacterium]